MTKSQTGNSLNFDMLKMFIIQAEANRLQAANKDHPSENPTTMASVQFANSSKWAKDSKSVMSVTALPLIRLQFVPNDWLNEAGEEGALQVNDGYTIINKRIFLK